MGAWEALAAWNPTADGWDPEVMLAWLTTAAATWAGDFEETTTAAAEEALAADDVEESLADALTGWTTTAALYGQTIATEARGFGGVDAARASGVGFKIWRTGGTNPRPSHRAQNNESTPIDDVFSNGLRWPGDRSGRTEETANCNCRMTYSREE
ncbi:hypothetical protein AB0I72_00520 [Nocardiopsis sp. NPDC049922]|uniref:hypothetical protein n=1 Tax=Nocardiopsis sp. NPDC049922 TaxID=3155157 RepID=UPI0033DD0E95